MKAIFACDELGGVGFRGKLPWPKIPGDLARFKRITENNTVLMGRGTYESKDMPIPLPNRRNVVVSTTLTSVVPGVELVSTLLPFRTDLNVWVIGGAKLITSTWHLLHEVHLTLVKGIYNCDATVDLTFLYCDFNLTAEDSCKSHSFQTWIRK